jgi:hypothetical protein
LSASANGNSRPFTELRASGFSERAAAAFGEYRPLASAAAQRHDQQLILEKKGWFMANVVGAVLDLEVQVEAVVAERVRASLASEGVAAIVEQVVTG